MSKFNKTNRFHMERLEDRQMMAGDVEVILAAGGNSTLLVKEAAGQAGTAQAVMVSRTPAGFTRIEGLPNADGGVTKVNGKPFVDFAQGFGLDFRLGGGSDEVRLQDVGYSGDIYVAVGHSTATKDNDKVIIDNVQTLGSLTISTAGGQDVVRVTNTQVGEGYEYYSPDDLTIRTGVDAAVGDADKDTVFLENIEVLGSLNVSTGASNDAVTLKDAELGHGSHHFHTALISTGIGADTVALGPGPAAVGAVGVTGNLHIGTGLDSENDVDKVTMQDVFVTNSLTMFLGGGDDVLDMVNTQAREDVAIITGRGNDTARLTQVEAFDGFFTSMGEGSDILDITFVKARTVNLDGGGGDGYDRLFLSQSPNIPTLIRTGFEEINGQKLIKKVTPQVIGGVLTRA